MVYPVKSKKRKPQRKATLEGPNATHYVDQVTGEVLEVIKPGDKPKYNWRLKMVILRIYDRISQIYEAPFPGDNGPAAIRGFEDALSNPETRYGKWPNDFDLLQVGHYESNSPTIYPDNPEIVLAQGANIISALAMEETRDSLAAGEAKKLAPIRN